MTTASRKFLRNAHVFVPWGMLAAACVVFASNGGRLPAFLDNGPASDWYAVESLEVAYDPEDGELVVCVRSEVAAAFQSTWTTTLRRIEAGQPGGHYVDGGIADRAYDYGPREMRTSCYGWTEYTNMAKAPSEDGLYRLYVTWPMIDDRGVKRTQRAQSNLFEVPDPLTRGN